MMVVIQCAAGKQPDAGRLEARDGKPVTFVAKPSDAPKRRDAAYARPDDLSSFGVSWRRLLLSYNVSPGNNPLALLPAYRLYRHPAYARLVERFGADKTFILSAGWGLISAAFLTPSYDITFSASADAYKRRKRTEAYEDFCMLPANSSEDLYFFGGKDYVPTFCELTAGHRGQRIVFYNAASPPPAPGCRLQRYKTTTRTNWHYECVNAFIDGTLKTRRRDSETSPTPQVAPKTQPPRPPSIRAVRRGSGAKPDIDALWLRLKQLQGEPFETKTGKAFTFEISGSVFHSSRTRYNLTKADFGKALELVPIDGPGEISHLVRGSAYIWAVLHDPRVRQGHTLGGAGMEALPMDEAAVRDAIRRASKGIGQYLWLMRELPRRDVSSCREFQKRYNAFYRVRQRSTEWYATYYHLLERSKKAGADFGTVLDTLQQKLGRYEPSFSSKLVATVDPHKPVWDRFVLMNTGLRAPSYADRHRFHKAKTVYSQICGWYSDCLDSERGRISVEIFNEEVEESARISDLKKLDFVLWQTRPERDKYG